MKKLIAGSFFAATLATAAMPAAAAVYVQVAPPAPRYEFAPAPRAGWVWVPGYWHRGHHRHAWVAGHWVRHRPGYVHAPTRWPHYAGGWRYACVR